jgi:SUMO ligase MMS21 Smc5/6 complex component
MRKKRSGMEKRETKTGKNITKKREIERVRTTTVRARCVERKSAQRMKTMMTGEDYLDDRWVPLRTAANLVQNGKKKKRRTPFCCLMLLILL